jgi:hypothetical protein
MKLIQRRLERLEEKAGRGRERISLVGIMGEPESEKRYEAYLHSGIRKPFVWIDTGVRRPSIDREPSAGGQE